MELNEKYTRFILGLYAGATMADPVTDKPTKLMSNAAYTEGVRNLPSLWAAVEEGIEYGATGFVEQLNQFSRASGCRPEELLDTLKMAVSVRPDHGVGVRVGDNTPMFINPSFYAATPVMENPRMGKTMLPIGVLGGADPLHAYHDGVHRQAAMRLLKFPDTDKEVLEAAALGKSSLHTAVVVRKLVDGLPKEKNWRRDRMGFLDGVNKYRKRK